ncbi:hypothetical protein GOP47_0021096 [Adiantum capillus-veneris]|uniref:Acid phosphatase n=1 Tax=Adiantum capillus-veneris TaxID=13818 RepID=A0A9D4UC94_ADICA|nr:hypothetical protein GOP47_0021096 [Adiantum capillus-veneris]
MAASATDEERDFEPLEPSTLPSPPSFKFDQNNSSSQNLLSRAGSGYESQYGSMFGSRFSLTDGSGVFLSSLALTIIVSAIAIVGIVLVAVIITLAVLLSSCDSRSTMTLQKQLDSGFCTSFRLNVELNNVQDRVVPLLCEDYMLDYVHGGQYLKDIEVSVGSASRYLKTLSVQHHEKKAVVLDVDETALSNAFYYTHSSKGLMDPRSTMWVSTTQVSPILPVRDLYRELRAANWSIFFISERPESLFDLTAKNLLESGFENWTSLILRSSDDAEGTIQAYKSRKRSEIEKQGYQIMSVLGDQWSDVTAPAPGTRTFKLPNPMYHII